MGAATSVRKLTVDSVALLEQLQPSATELQRKREVRALVQRELAREWPACRVLPFGSSESGMGFSGSDVDLGIYFTDTDVAQQSQLTLHERARILETARERLGAQFEVTAFVPHARVPVLKLWDPVRQVACDVSVGGVNVLLNTALLQYYGRVDARVRPLAFAIKYWAKRRGINDAANGTLSSYGFSLLLIFYLQARPSPLLPAAQLTQFPNLQCETNLSALLQRLHAFPTVGPHAPPTAVGTPFQDSVGGLLAGFFQFYASQFDWEKDVVSVRSGVPLRKATKWSHSVAWRLSIEDPFELAHDVGRVIFSRKGQELLVAEFHRAFDLVCAGTRLDAICSADATSWNASASCYLCDSSEHKARECARLQLPRHLDDIRFAGGVSASLTPLAFNTECWYCGESGHFKAACPMQFFCNIPLQPDWPGATTAPPYSPPRPRISAPKSQPIPIPTTKKNSVAVPGGGANRSRWERGMSPPKPSKKKKRACQSPAVLVLSPTLSTLPVPSALASPSLLKKRRKRRHRHHLQRCALSSSPPVASSGAGTTSMQPRKLDIAGPSSSSS